MTFRNDGVMATTSSVDATRSPALIRASQRAKIAGSVNCCVGMDWMNSCDMELGWCCSVQFVCACTINGNVHGRSVHSSAEYCPLKARCPTLNSNLIELEQSARVIDY